MSTAVAPTTLDPLTPVPGESYAQFVQRAHYSLVDSCPDWEERNRQVWDAWEKRNGEPLRLRAQRYFDGHRFIPNVCYFSEHETIGRDGKPVRYSFNELSDIVDEHNSRADRHNYSALAERHTVDGNVSAAMEPRVVGFVGSARLGMVGNEKPHWAAFFDEHHKTDSYSQGVLADKQRRSVEVNRYRDGRRPYFDPVAVLGADSPRLPLPVARYAAEDESREVERYSVVAPAMVSGTNTFIPQFRSGSNKGQPNQYASEPSMGLTPEDIQAVVQAILSTPQMQWVDEQMGSGGATAQQQPPQAPPPSQAPPGNGGNGHAPGGQYMHPGAGGGQQLQLPRYSVNENEDEGMEKENYQVLEDKYAELSERYSKLNEVNADLMKAHGQTRQAVVELERRECDKDRELRLRELYQKYPHFVEVDEELDRCLYSRGSEMTQDDFSNHIESVERYAAKSSPVTRMVPGGQLPNPNEKERYEAELADRIVERYTACERRGEIKSYEELEAEIRKELGITA